MNLSEALHPLGAIRVVGLLSSSVPFTRWQGTIFLTCFAWAFVSPQISPQMGPALRITRRMNTPSVVYVHTYIL